MSSGCWTICSHPVWSVDVPIVSEPGRPYSNSLVSNWPGEERRVEEEEAPLAVPSRQGGGGGEWLCLPPYYGSKEEGGRGSVMHAV